MGRVTKRPTAIARIKAGDWCGSANIRAKLTASPHNVSVTQIAEAAGVSKMTVFNYFPAKEDLVLKPLEEHMDEPARLIRTCLAEGSGLRESVLACIVRHDPIVGMNDSPQVLSVHQLVMGTPSLVQRAGRLAARSEELVAGELRTRARPTWSPGSPPPRSSERSRHCASAILRWAKAETSSVRAYTLPLAVHAP